MREIKIRAWDESKSVMIYFGKLTSQNTGGFWGGTREVYQISSNKGFGKCEGAGYFHSDFAEDVELKLMLFTGFQDKNGVDVYEGDIIKYDNGMTSTVEFGVDLGCCGYNIAGYNFSYDDSKYEVVGNIYEN